MNKSSNIIRYALIMFVLVAVFFVFIYRLLTIQVVDSSYYKDLMVGRTVSTQHIKATRGEILDSDGNPLIVNETGYDIILDAAYLPKEEKNDILLLLTQTLDAQQESWTDNLPISWNTPYTFLENRDSEIQTLKTTIDAQSYASAEDVMYWLVQRYELEDYTQEDARKIAGIRYEMERRDFSLRIPYTFATDVSIETVIYLKEHNYMLPGVTPQASATRYYSVVDLAPHLLGTVGPLYKEEYQELKEEQKTFQQNAINYDTRGYTMDDTIGKSGVEKAFEEYLRGYNGTRGIETDSSGNVINTVETISPIPGNTVYLTIDSDLQRVAQNALESQIQFLQESPTAPVEAKNADAGAVAVVEVKTGKILAAATYPTYNLTDYTQNYSEVASRTGSPLVDRSIYGQYTPGSIYKPTVALAALSNNVISSTTRYNCTYIYHGVSAGDHTFKCLSSHGLIDVVGALRTSCNIFFYDAGKNVGIDAIDATAIQMGLGEPTGIELEFVPNGQRSNPAVKEELRGETWYEADTIQSSIGQLDNKFTPLQLANYAATIGNGGNRMQLTLVSEVRDYSRQEVIQEFTPKIAYANTSISQENLDVVIQGMVAASKSGGTSQGTFSNYPITVASKTGTPQVNSEEVNSTFIAFAPAEDPQIAVCVVIEKGWHGYTGASVAKAVFDEYFSDYFAENNIGFVYAPVANGPDQMHREQEAAAALEAEKNFSESSEQTVAGEVSEGEQPPQAQTDILQPQDDSITDTENDAVPNTVSENP